MRIKFNKSTSKKLKPSNKNIVKIILLFILSILLLPLVPAIVATIILKKSNLKKPNKTIFITLSWFLNFFLIGVTAPETPNPETKPIIALNKEIPTSNTEATTETTSENNSEISTTTINTKPEISNITNEDVTIQTTTSITENNSKEVITTQPTTVIETTTQPTTKEIITEKQTQATAQINKEFTTNNVEIKTLYVGNKSNGKLHTSYCRHAKKLLPENIVQFDSKDDAIAAGYNDFCKVCFK